MNKTNFIIVFSFLLLLITACGESKPETVAVNELQQEPPTVANVSESDSLAILKIFEKLKSDKSFLDALYLSDEEIYSWYKNSEGIVWGDLNKDGNEDALFPFTIEGRGGGNNWDSHYAVFLKKDNQWFYQSQFDANAGSPRLFYDFGKIENGKIYGFIKNKNDESYEVPVEFIFNNNELINTFTALHATDPTEREFLEVNEIQNTNNISIPLTATLKEYQRILGSGKITDPEEQPQCGTYFDEGTYNELHYPNLTFELNNKKNAAFIQLTFKGSDFRLQTNKGTITEKTTLTELKNVLQKSDSWQIDDEEDGSGRFLTIPNAEGSDVRWILRFNKKGNIVNVSTFIPC